MKTVEPDLSPHHPSQSLGFDNAEKEVLHPYVAQLVNSFHPRRMLDFGCGNGFFSTLISDTTKVDLYDPAVRSEEELVSGAIRKNVQLLNSECDIISNHYDCVVQSSVLMCVPTKDELRRVFSVNAKALKIGGLLVVVVTHPCFLQYGFGHYYTSFDHHNFHYLDEGAPYTVYMKNGMNPAIEFTDFHWPLSVLINLILDVNLRIRQIVEHPDIAYKAYVPHASVPPWMFIIAEREQ